MRIYVSHRCFVRSSLFSNSAREACAFPFGMVWCRVGAGAATDAAADAATDAFAPAAPSDRDASKAAAIVPPRCGSLCLAFVVVLLVVWYFDVDFGVLIVHPKEAVIDAKQAQAVGDTPPKN